MATTWADVGTAVTRRREELRLNQQQAALHSGASPTTWQKVEVRSEPVSPRSLAKMASVLRWPVDFADRLLAGESPESLPTVEPLAFIDGRADAQGKPVNILDRIEQAVRHEVERAAQELPFEDVEQLARLVIWLHARADADPGGDLDAEGLEEAWVEGLPSVGDYLDLGLPLTEAQRLATQLWQQAVDRINKIRDDRADAQVHDIFKDMRRDGLTFDEAQGADEEALRAAEAGGDPGPLEDDGAGAVRFHPPAEDDAP